jgi:hypothetical protein
MNSWLDFILGLVLIVIWITGGVYVTEANILLTPHKNDDDNLKNAYNLTFWASFITWFLVALFIVLLILSIVGVVALFGSGAGEIGAAESVEAKNFLSSQQGQTTISYGISWFTVLFLIVAIILIVTTGILSAIAASDIAKSGNTNIGNSYSDCIVAASLCISAAGVILIAFIVYYILDYQKEQKFKNQEQIELEKIKEIKEQAYLNKLGFNIKQ